MKVVGCLPNKIFSCSLSYWQPYKRKTTKHQRGVIEHWVDTVMSSTSFPGPLLFPSPGAREEIISPLSLQGKGRGEALGTRL